jgi:hypothetical protein
VQEFAPILSIVRIDRTTFDKDAALVAVDDLLFDEHERSIGFAEQSTGRENDDDVDLVVGHRLHQRLETGPAILLSSRFLVEENMTLGDFDAILLSPSPAC